jgi:UDP-N-acetylglucosamine 3-dehydrogenase
VLIAENFRYDPAVQRARELIAGGKLGSPFMLSYQYTQPVPPGDEIASRPWRQQPAHAGGCLSDHGVHMIDTVRYLMGEIVQVQVFARDLRPDLVGLDTAIYNLKFASGALGSIQWSFSVASEPTSFIQIWSETATLQVRPAELRLQQPGQPDEFWPIARPASFVNEFADFYETLVNGKKPYMTGQDALKDLEVVLAAYRSVISGQVVTLTEEKQLQ